MTLPTPSGKIARLMQRILVWAVSAWVCAVPFTVAASDAETDGLRAYVAGRFDEAAVGLKQSIRERARGRDASDAAPVRVSGQTAYFAGRSFEELGLRGLALHYLAQAELYGTPQWRLLARRELTQLYFEATDYAAVMQVIDRMAGEPPDPEIHYFAGLAAAELRAWPQSIEMLSRVDPSSGFWGYALYARAQARAANGDLAGAIADLDDVIARSKSGGAPRTILTVFSSGDRPHALLEQAEVLRGKILLVDGRDREAREAFAAVTGKGRVGLEAVRGLLMTGEGVDAASRVEVSPSRPVDMAALLAVKAMAAEEHGQVDEARRIRTEVRHLARERLTALDRLSTDADAEETLERDLSDFWHRLRLARWRQRWREEEPSLSNDVAGAVGSPREVPDDSFMPRDGIFYGVWDQARANAWLSGLVELRASAEELSRAIELAPQRGSIWKFWRRDEDRRLADALLVIRVANLRQRIADHLHNFAALDDAGNRTRKRDAVEAAIDRLHRLYLGTEAKVPPLLANLEKGLEYKRYDMFRLVDAVPERATDPVISLAGNYVDLLADLRSRLSDGGQSMPAASAAGPKVLEELHGDDRMMTSETSDYIRRAIEPTRRAQVAFFTRVEADNESSLSRLFGRAGGERKETK
jgi:tetratricopeptide (TPR) repeat protein